MAGFWQQQGCRHGLCGRKPGAALCQTQLLPAVFARDPSQATAEPISRAGGTSVKTCLRKGRKCQEGGNRERTREWRGGGKNRGKNRANNKVRGLGGALWWSKYISEGTVACG